MNYLLLVVDEVEAASFLTEELGLEQVGPAAHIDRELPSRASSEPRDFIFWAPNIGPLRSLGDAPPPRDATEAVLRKLNRDSHPDRWQDLLDVARSPVLRMHRSN